MGKVLSTGARHIAQRFNVESRAHKVISKDKPTKAPWHESNMKDLERILKDHPEIVEESSKKSSELDDRLKAVYVTSSEYLEQRRIINPERPLPKNTEFSGYFEYGFKETDVGRVPRGKVSLRNAIDFISKHQTSPKDFTAEKISAEYKLNLEDVQNILDNFRMFEVSIPTEVGKTKKYLFDPFNKSTTNLPKMLEQLKPEEKPKEKKDMQG